MRAQGWAALVASLAIGSAVGCGWQSDSRKAESGAVAVIDLDEIARRLGSDRQIASSIAQRQTALGQQLVNLAKSYNAQIAEEKSKLAAAEGQTDDFQVKVASWEQQANANLNQVKQRAAADLQNHRALLFKQFRDQIKPAARRVAQKRGLTVIVTKNDSVLFDYTSTADITEAVVDELLASAQPAIATPVATQPAAPAVAPTPQGQPPAQGPAPQQATAPTEPRR